MGQFWKRTRVGVVQRRCRFKNGGLYTSGTLGGAASSLIGLIVGGTLVSGVRLASTSGMTFARWSCCAISNSAFRTGSPSCRLGTVGAGGWVRILIMSSVACSRWSRRVTFGKGTSVWEERYSLAHSRRACAGEVTGDAAVMIQCGTNVPSHFSVELPRASVCWVYMCNDLGAWRCYGRRLEVVRAVDVRVR